MIMEFANYIIEYRVRINHPVTTLSFVLAAVDSKCLEFDRAYEHKSIIDPYTYLHKHIWDVWEIIRDDMCSIAQSIKI